MERPKERTSNLHRQAGYFSDVLMDELTLGFFGSYSLSQEKLKEYLRSAYLRGYEDRVMEETERNRLKAEANDIS